MNQNLLQGPDLTNGLIGVLCRFREKAVAFSCDVQSMFHQFFVNEEDRDLFRFLWWENGDLETRPVEYRMKVHVFGAGSSPGCANFGLKQCADDGEEEFGTDTAEFVRWKFYDDDFFSLFIYLFTPLHSILKKRLITGIARNMQHIHTHIHTKQKAKQN